MLMHINVKYKYLPLFIAFIMFSFNLFIPLTTVFAEEDNPLRCTYGVYDADAHGIVESNVDYYDTMNFNGFCEGVYQYYIDNYPNINFISFVEFKHYVSSTLNLQFWDALVNNAYYLNVYCNDDTIVILAQHQPEDIFPPVVSWTPTESGRDVTLGIVQDTAYFIYDTGKLFMYEPPVSFWISNDVSFYESPYMGFLYSGTNNNFSTNEYLLNSINGNESFGYAFVFHVSDIPNLTFSFLAPWTYGSVTNYHNSLGVFSEVYSITGETSIDLTFDYEPVMTTFPVWTPTENFFVGSTKLEYLQGNTPIVTVENPNIYGNLDPNFRVNYDLSPIIASNYTDVPIATPTPTPTAIPQITLYPTPTPYVVETMEGVGQMFTLFTRKYTFNINGVDIGIRPFYLVLACFIVGSIFTMVQGGNKS